MDRKSQILTYSLLLFPASIALPISLKLKSICLIICFVSLLWNMNFSSLFNTSINNKLIIILYSLFFLIEPVIGFIREGFATISDVRLSFIVAPVLFFGSKKFVLGHYWKILNIFLASIYAYLFYAIIFVIYFFMINDTIPFRFNFYLKYVLYHYLPGAIHHTYLGMYIALGLIIILFGKKFNISTRILLSTPLVLSAFFITSKLSIIVIFLLFIFWLFKTLLFKHKKILLVLCCLLFAISSFFVFKTDIFRTFLNSFNNRVAIYRCSFEGISSNWLWGMGKERVKPFIKNCTNDMLEMDTHNVYLQEILSSGFFAFLTLLLLLFALMFKGKGNIVFKLFLIIFFLFGMVEHLLNLQLGATFFVFFSLLFLLNSDEVNILQVNSNLKLWSK